MHAKTTAGIIVYTSEHLANRANELLLLGVDDFIRKAEVSGEFGNNVENMQSYLRAKVLSVWKRTQFSRPTFKTFLKHVDRKFQLGKWIFAIESRSIETDQEKQKLTASEHAILRHLCVSEEHSINQSEFLSFITGQTSNSEDVRLKNLIYRLRQKLGPSVNLVYSDFSYRLLSIAEIPNTKPAAISRSAGFA
jgi:DNA-binding response OmpR family regulator